MKPVVGLTGGIACGKSTVAKLFSEQGIPIIDADALARKVVEPGTKGLELIIETFGAEYLQADGTLDRKKLSAHVFGNDEARNQLNAIIHPLIATEGMDAISALQDHPAPYVLYEAALLVENNSYAMFTALIVVAASPETQRQRLLARDHFNEDEAQARIDAQLPMEDKIAVADYVIHNDGSSDELMAQVQTIHAALVKRFTA